MRFTDERLISRRIRIISIPVIPGTIFPGEYFHVFREEGEGKGNVG